MTVKIIANQQHTTVVILHHFVIVDFFHSAVCRHVLQHTASTVARRHIDLAILVDRCGNHGDATREILLPQQLAVNVETKNFLPGQLDVLALAEMIHCDN